MLHQPFTVAEAVPTKTHGRRSLPGAHYGKNETEGSYYYKGTFNEVIIEDVNGKMGFFDRMQSVEAVDFIRKCEFPIRLELARYHHGSGLEYRYTPNKRRSCWIPQAPNRKRVLVDHMPKNRGEQVDTANRMSEADIPYVITAKMIGVCVNSVIDWHAIFRRQAATVGAKVGHDRTTTNRTNQPCSHPEPSREDHSGAGQAGEHGSPPEQEAGPQDGRDCQR